MSDHFTNRWQYVFDNERTTEKLPVITGVPQGSILGPFLFLVYINDLPAVCSMKSKIAIFADDNSLIQPRNQNMFLIKIDTNEMTNWFACNKLSINFSKCETISFSIGKPPALKIDNISNPDKPHCKYLGVQLEPELNFREHISYVAKKLNKFCRLVYRGRYMYPKKCLSTFYDSYAETIIRYGLLSYGSAHKSDLENIDQSQRRILRAFFSKRKFDNLRDDYQQTKILTIYEMFDNEVFREIINQLRSKYPLDFRDNRNNRYIYETRRSVKGLLPITYSRTVTKSKSLKNTQWIGYNWLTSMDLLPSNLTFWLSNKMLSQNYM